MLEKIIYTLGLLLVIALVFYLSYVTTRFIGSKAGRVSDYSKKRHLQIIETMCLGRDKYLYLMKAGNEYILISSSNKGIEMLGNIDIDVELDAAGETEEDRKGQIRVQEKFKEVFSNYLNRSFGRYDSKKINEEQTDNAKKQM